MPKLKAKQIDKIIGAKLATTSYNNTLNINDNVTTIINNKLSNMNLLNQIATSDVGIDSNYICEIYYNETKSPYFADNGSQIFGVLSKSGTTWTITYKYFNYNTNLLEDYTFTKVNDLFIIFSYKMQLKDYNYFNINNYNYQQNKIIVTINNIEEITINYNPKLFGQIPLIQFWDSNTKSIEIVQATLDDILNPTEIYINFGYVANGYVVIR